TRSKRDWSSDVCSSDLAWINSATLLAFFLVLVYVSGLMGVIICLGLLCFMAVMYLQNRLRMMNFGKKRREYAIKSNAQVTTAFESGRESCSEKDRNSME